MLKKNYFRKIEENIGLLWSVLFTVIFFVIIKIGYTVFLVSPDDAIMCKILSGGVTGEPYAYDYFQQFFYTFVVANLYRIAPWGPWYILSLIGALFLCVLFISIRIFDNRIKNNLIKTVVFLFVLLGLGLSVFVEIEWTVVAGVLAATSIFWVGTIDHGQKKSVIILQYVIGAFLFIWSFGIRDSVAIMSIPFGVLIVFITGINSWEKKRFVQFKSQIIFLTCVTVVVSVLGLIDVRAYSTDEWVEYKEYTINRSRLMDYYGFPSFDENYELYDEMGISEEAYLLMSSSRNYVIAQDEFTIENIKELGKYAKQQSYMGVVSRISRAVNIIRNIILSKSMFPFLFLFFVMMAIAEISLQTGNIYRSMLYLMVIGVMGYLAYKGRLPERVALPVLFCAISVLGIYIWKNVDLIKVKRISIINLFLVTSVIVICTGKNISESQSDYDTLSRKKLTIVEYCKENPDNIYLRDFSSFIGLCEYATLQENYVCPNYISAGGWLYLSPMYNMFAEKYDFKDVTKSIIENENVYYLVSEKNYEYTKGLIERYFSSKNKQIETVVTDQLYASGENIFVLKFVETDDYMMKELKTEITVTEGVKQEDNVTSFTTDVEGNQFNAVNLQLYDAKTGEYIDRICSNLSIGYMNGIYEHNLESGLYLIKLKANSNLQDEYVETRVYLTKGKKMSYSYLINTLDGKYVEVSDYHLMIEVD